MDIDSIKQRLETLRADLLHDEETSADERKPVELDQSSVGRLSRMDALQVQAMQVETERRRMIQVNRIDTALARLEAGDYGYCTACDEEIAPKRLENDPAVPTCIACAQGSNV